VLFYKESILSLKKKKRRRRGVGWGCSSVIRALAKSWVRFPALKEKKNNGKKAEINDNPYNGYLFLI
jgi:hypothetical protein